MQRLSIRALLFAAIVDECWHAHMQFTRHYATYCKLILGKYLHHDPTDDKPSGMTMYQRTLITYALQFKSVPPVRWWPRPANFEPGLLSLVATGKPPKSAHDHRDNQPDMYSGDALFYGLVLTSTMDGDSFYVACSGDVAGHTAADTSADVGGKTDAAPCSSACSGACGSAPSSCSSSRSELCQLAQLHSVSAI